MYKTLLIFSQLPFDRQMTILLATLSIIITIGWNFSNRRHTDNTARKIRAEAFEADEWKLHRADILRTLREFENTIRSISILSKTTAPVEDVISETNSQSKEITLAHMELLTELERGQYDPCWSGLGYGNTDNDGETDWDRLVGYLAAVATYTSTEEAKVALTETCERAKSISQLINGAIKQKNDEFRPQPQTKSKWLERQRTKVRPLVGAVKDYLIG